MFRDGRLLQLPLDEVLLRHHVDLRPLRVTGGGAVEMPAYRGVVVGHGVEGHGIRDKVDLNVVVVPVLPLGPVSGVDVPVDDHAFRVANQGLLRKELRHRRVQKSADVVDRSMLLSRQEHRNPQAEPALRRESQFHWYDVADDLLHVVSSCPEASVAGQRPGQQRQTLGLILQPQ